MSKPHESLGEVVPFPESSAPTFSEEALALEFANLQAYALRYVPLWGRWMIWSGASWRRDTTLAAFDSIRPLVRASAAAAREAGSRERERLAQSIASASTVAAVERLARADRRIATTPEIWDQDPMLLGTPGGYINLETGGIGPCTPNAHVSRLTTVAPAEATACPRWLKFLEEVTGGDEELIAFLRRVAGYCLTGRTSEHALFFLLGPGRTGKSVFIEALAFAHGDYAAVASMDTFVESRGERHPTDLAMLQGARLVVASETEKDRVWAAARLKQLTGGDRVTARYMRQDFFTYSPQFKLMIAGNHPPKFAAMDEALRARIHIIPFNVFVPPAKRDKALSKALAGEAAGILRWALEGCLEWQKVGLAPPDAVQRATASFLGTIDPVSRWIEARCLREPNAKAAFADLFDDWIAWAACEGEHAGSEKQLSQSLRKRGIVPHRTPSGAAGFLGLRLKSPGSDTD